MVRAALLLTAALLASACDKASVQACDKATRNYFKLMYWEKAEAEIAAAPEAERAALRIRKQEGLEPMMMKSIDLAVQKCVSGADKARVECWTKATTAPQAKACQNSD
jgi:hypothetical protein